MSEAATHPAANAPVRREPANAGFRIVPAEEIGTIAAGWMALAGRSIADNVFFGADFAIPAIDRFGGGVAIAVATNAAGAPVALAPFTRTRLGRIAPAVRLWGHKYAPLGAPLVDGGDAAAALAVLVDGLAPEGSGLGLIVPDLVADSAIAEALRAVAINDGRPLAILDDHRRAMLTRGPATLDPRGALPTGKRKEFGRQMRRLAELGPVTIESATDADGVRARFEEFLALEQAGWKGRRGTALASTAADAAFAREAIANLADSGRARIESLRVGDHAVAVLVSLIAGATAYTWKIAYDEAWGRFSPGAQLMLEVPARLFADMSVVRIDSCAAADHPMIDHLWAERVEIATFVLGPPGGSALHTIGVAAARAEIAARANVRHLRAQLGR